MLTLPPISIRNAETVLELALPCPDVELVRLIALIHRSSGSVGNLLAENPSMLIYFANAYRAEFATPPHSLAELVKWWAVRSAETFDGLTWQLHAAKGPISRKCLKCFLKARTNSELRKSLSRFVADVSDCRLTFTRRWIQEILGREFFIPHDDPVSRRKRKRRRRAIVRAWQCSLSRPLDIAALLATHSQLRQLKQEFQNQLLAQKMAALKQLAYGASHEINNPLANIATRAQTMLLNETTPERQHKLAIIYEQALRSHEMISDLMLFANPPSLEWVNVDLRCWIATVLKEVKQTLKSTLITHPSEKSKPIELEVRIGLEIDRLTIDPTHLSVALKALIRNSEESIRSTAGAGTIGLRIYRDATLAVCFAVTDEGAGVSAAAVPHLFDPFYSGREAGRGLGFGLSKAWRIAELHGGELIYDDQHTPGACFVLRIPAVS